MMFTWDASPTLQLFGLPLRIYGLIFAATFLIGWRFVIWQVLRGGGSERDASWVMGISFLSVWLGGRLGHFFFYENELFLQHPEVIFDLGRGGMASHGSIAFVTLAYFIYSRIRKTSFIDLLDRMAFPMALGAGSIRIGNLFNSEVVGRVTDGTWGVRFPIFDYGKDPFPLRHPSQIYESVIGFTILAALFFLANYFYKKGIKRPIGLVAGSAWLTYGVGRFIVEFWKEYQAKGADVLLDASANAGIVLTMGQWLSLVPICLGILLLFYARKGRPEQFGFGTPL